MRLLPACCLLLLLFACGCETDIVTGDTPVEVEDSVVEPAGENSAFSTLETSTLAAVNEVRAAGCLCGSTRMPPVPVLQLDAKLSAAARAHSSDQARNGKMTHQGSDGSNVGDRVTRAGFDWRSVGENVAWNYRNVDHVMEGWLASEGHCKNIMSANFTSMGMGETALYWTQVFAR
ncbi:MAG: CAP domain-containing protein [Bacteroidota bacterium]